MNDEVLVQTLSKLRKELLWTRFFSILTSLLLVAVLIGGFMMWNKAHEYEQQVKAYAEQVEEYAQELEPVIRQVSLLNVDRLNETLNQVNGALEEVDWEQVSLKIGELDVDAINSAIDGLDTEELTKALENLNSVAEKLRKIGDAFSSLGEKLGIS